MAKIELFKLFKDHTATEKPHMLVLNLYPKDQWQSEEIHGWLLIQCANISFPIGVTAASMTVFGSKTLKQGWFSKGAKEEVLRKSGHMTRMTASQRCCPKMFWTHRVPRFSATTPCLRLGKTFSIPDTEPFEVEKPGVFIFNCWHLIESKVATLTCFVWMRFSFLYFPHFLVTFCSQSQVELLDWH